MSREDNLYSPLTTSFLIISYKLITRLIDCIISQMHKYILLQPKTVPSTVVMYEMRSTFDLISSELAL